MNRTRPLSNFAALVAALALGGAAQAEGPPSNEELYRMILEQQKVIDELRTSQGQLRQDAADARGEAASARAEAANAQAEATQAKQELERTHAALAEVRAEVSELPDVAGGLAGPSPAGTGAFASFDVLYWDVDGGTERDYVIVQDPGAAGIGDPRGDVRTVTWDADVGFRGEAGYRFGNGIDVLFRGLGFDTDGDASETDPNQNMTALSLHHEEDDFGDTDVGFAEVDMDVEFLQFDLETGKWFSIGDGVALRPFATLRYADIEYDLASRFCDETDCAFTGDVETHRSRVDWWGMGVLGGLEGEWRFWDRFSLFGRGAAGVLGGRYDSRAEVREPDNPGTDLFRADEDGTSFVPTLEASIGMGIRLVDSDAFSLGIEAGYEALSFFDAPQPFQGLPDDIENVADADEETVTFHGAFFRLDLGF